MEESAPHEVGEVTPQYSVATIAVLAAVDFVLAVPLAASSTELHAQQDALGCFQLCQDFENDPAVNSKCPAPAELEQPHPGWPLEREPGQLVKPPAARQVQEDAIHNSTSEPQEEHQLDDDQEWVSDRLRSYTQANTRK